jgi:hypothetical protein
MNIYLEQLKLHKQSLEMALSDIGGDRDEYNRKLERLEAAEKNVIAQIAIANEQIAKEEAQLEQE